MSTAPAKAPQTKPAGPASTEGLFSSPEKRTVVLSLLLVVFTLGIYNQAAHFGFVNFDDDRYITDNQHVRAGLTWNTVKWALVSTDEANWHPLTWMSHALDCSLFRLNPAGHHYTSVLLHGINVVLVFLLLWRGTRRAGPSFLVAAVFALHPINAESVAWVSERKNVLSTTFFLLTLGAYGAYALKPNWKRYLAVVALFACGLAAKPMLVTLPFVLLLLDFWPLFRISRWSSTSAVLEGRQVSLRRLVLEKLPLFALALASAAITMHAQRTAGAIGILPYPLDVRLKNAIVSYAIYVWKAIWPADLAPLYPYLGHDLALWKLIAAALFLIATTLLVLKMRQSRSYLLVGWLWFLGTLVPVIGLVQVGNQSMADRYAYIPLLGIFVMVMFGAADLADSYELRPALKLMASLALLAALSFTSYRQIGYWRSSLDLWTHALAVTQNNFVAEDSLGGALVDLGRTDEAYPHFVRAAEIQPADPVAHCNVGAYLHQHGHPREAVAEYQLAVQLTVDARLRATTYANMGAAYRELGNLQQSQASFEQALRLNPNQFNAWLGMGLLAEQEGRLNDAAQDFSRSLQLRPTAEGFFRIGQVLALTGHPSDALQAFQNALQLDPNMAEARQAAAALSH